MSAADLSEAAWRISSHSDGNEGTYVEVAAAATGRLIATRDSTDRTGPVLFFGQGEWRAFLGRIKGSESGLR